MCEVGGCSLGSDEFAELWSRPALAADLIAIWERRQQVKAGEYEMFNAFAVRSLSLNDVVATFIMNFGAKGNGVKSALAEMFPDKNGRGSSTKPLSPDKEAEIVALIAAKERERRERLGIG